MRFVDLHRQRDVIRGSLDSRMNAVIERGDFVLGKDVAELETALAEFVGVKHCIGVANGTDALQLCLRALGVGPGDGVFVPSFTFVATAECVSQVGAVPLFVDVDASSFNMDAGALERAIARASKDTDLCLRAVIVVDLFGLAADYAELEAIAGRHNLDVVEDGAQALGARLGERRACSFGALATTSFFPAKPLGCYGDGGAVFTDRDDLADLVRSLHVHGQGADKYDNARVGLNSRLDTLQAAVLLAKLEVFEQELARRDEIAAFYSDHLADGYVTPEIPRGSFSAWAQYTLQVDRGRRDSVCQQLADGGIPTAVYYSTPLHRQPVYRDAAGLPADCPVTEELSDKVFSIPVHPYLTDAECEQVVSALQACR